MFDEIGQDFADYGCELEAVPGEAGGNGHVGEVRVGEDQITGGADGEIAPGRAQPALRVGARGIGFEPKPADSAMLGRDQYATAER